MKRLLIGLFLALSIPLTLAQTETKEELPVEPEQTAPPKPASRISGTVERPRTPAEEKQAMQLMVKNIPEQHVKWLETEFGPFVSVWYQNQSGDSKGALLIIHSEGESPLWPETTAPLHHSLPNSGWSTLAVSLPNQRTAPIPKRTFPTKVRRVSTDLEELVETEGEPPTTEAAEKPSTNTSKPTSENLVKETSKVNMVKPLGPDPEEVSLARLKSAMKFLHDRGQFNIVVAGYGAGAIRANELLKELTPTVKNPDVVNAIQKPFRGFIIVNGRNHLLEDQETIVWFSDPDLPVLDVFINIGSRHQAAEERRIQARRNKIKIYQMVGLPEMVSLEEQENRLSRRIRSFLKKYAEGIEVNNARLRKRY